MALQLKKAQRKRVKLKIGMSAPAGGGKTLGSLLIAYGIVKEENPGLSEIAIWDKIAIIDSENGSGELYVNKTINGITIGEYGVVSLGDSIDPETYIAAMDLCEKSGVSVTIIDSTSHLWRDLLEKQGSIAKRTGNSYTAWRDVTPLHNKFVDKMLQCNMHIIATMRSKTEYVQEKNDQGKTVVRKVGLAPVQKDGMEFEFTLFLDIDAEHNAFGSKDRTGIFDQKFFVINQSVGTKLVGWLNEASDNQEAKVIATQPTSKPDNNSSKPDITALISRIAETATELPGLGIDKTAISKVIEANLIVNGKASANYNKITDITSAENVLKALQTLRTEALASTPSDAGETANSHEPNIDAE